MHEAHETAEKEAAFIVYMADIRQALHAGSRTTAYIERLVRDAFMAGWAAGSEAEPWSEAA